MNTKYWVQFLHIFRAVGSLFSIKRLTPSPYLLPNKNHPVFGNTIFNLQNFHFTSKLSGFETLFDASLIIQNKVVFRLFLIIFHHPKFINYDFRRNKISKMHLIFIWKRKSKSENNCLISKFYYAVLEKWIFENLSGPFYNDVV